MEFEEKMKFSLEFPAKFLYEGHFKSRSEKIVRRKIDDYRRRHQGKYPAKMFITLYMLLDFIPLECYMSMTRSEKEGIILFGVPASLFDGEGKQIYLSDEEA